MQRSLTHDENRYLKIKQANMVLFSDDLNKWRRVEGKVSAIPSQQRTVLDRVVAKEVSIGEAGKLKNGIGEMGNGGLPSGQASYVAESDSSSEETD